MRQSSRLDKTISGLQKLVQRHNKQDKFQISKNSIRIYANGQQFWGTVFYIVVLLLLPAGLFVYYLLTDKANAIIFWLLLLELLFGYDLWKMVRGNTILTIDFTAKHFRIENINGVFKKWFKPKTIAFDEISEFKLREKSVASKYGRTAWLQLSATDKANNNIVFTDMNNDYPESYIARKVKFLMDIIIWTEKQNISNVA